VVPPYSSPGAAERRLAQAFMWFHHNLNSVHDGPPPRRPRWADVVTLSQVRGFRSRREARESVPIPQPARPMTYSHSLIMRSRFLHKTTTFDRGPLLHPKSPKLPTELGEDPKELSSHAGAVASPFLLIRSPPLLEAVAAAMDLLIVRHGIAEDREEFASTEQPDDLRPLTREGKREFTKVARALHGIVPELDLIATSPLVRARQTAELLGERYGVPVVETDALQPEAAYTKFAALVKRSTSAEVVAIVGHEPHLSGLVAWLIGDTDARIAMKKGCACLVRFDRAAQRGAGTLLWLLPPGVLRRLRRG
jgi:phosphohistidine phosphatase